MKKRIIITAFLFLMFFSSIAQVAEKEGYVAIEMESTSSSLGNWKKIKQGDLTFIPTASGGVHLEFTGNNPSSGPADSPLEYTFTINTPGTYALMIRCSKRLDGQAEDKCNDSFVRIEGDYSSPYTGTPDKEPDYKGLSTNQKIFGGLPHPEMGWATSLDYLGHIKKKPRYVFKAGQTYKIVFSGRAQRFNPDYFVLYNQEMYSPEEAQLISPTGKLKPTISSSPIIDRSCWSKGAADAWDLTKPDNFKAKGVKEGKKGFQINTLKEPHNEWATAKITFDGETGVYPVKFTSLLETDGECSYKVLIDGKLIIEFQNPRILGTDKKEYTPYTVGVKKVAIAKGAIIQVDYNSHSNGLVPEKDSFAWARGRWKSISIGKCDAVVVETWMKSKVTK